MTVDENGGYDGEPQTYAGRYFVGNTYGDDSPAGSFIYRGVGTLVTAPNGEQWRFLGWHTQKRAPDKSISTSGSRITSASTVAYRPALYAAWQRPTEVTFDPNGGEIDYLPNKSYYRGYPYGELPTLKPRDGFLFERWETPDGTVVRTYSTVLEDIELRARWTEAVKVIFDAEDAGGSLPPDFEPPYYFPGHEYGFLPVPTHPRLQFAGWFDYYGNRVTKTSIVPEGGTTLYAAFDSAYYEVELNGQWRKSAAAKNPDETFFDGVYESFSNHNYQSDSYDWASYDPKYFALMFIRVNGYKNFDIFIRSSSEAYYDGAYAFEPDYIPSEDDLRDWFNGSTDKDDFDGHALATTIYDPNSGTALHDYTPVHYDLDGGEHVICVAYLKDVSADHGDDRGYLLIARPEPYSPDADSSGSSSSSESSGDSSEGR